MTRLAVCIIATAALVASGFAQDDTVPLKNGQVLVGKVTQKTADGLTLEKWDGSGTVNITWSQIPERDLPRFKETAVKEEPRTDVASIEGVRLVTAYRVVDGIVDHEDANTVWMKTRESKSPLQFPKTGIVAREKILLRESDIYTPDELLDARIKKAIEAGDITKPEVMIQLAEYALSQSLTARALALYDDAKAELTRQKDKATEEDAKNKIDKQIEELDIRVKEIRGRSVIEEIFKLLEKNDYDKALSKAQSFMTDYEGTRIKEQNADLVDRINKERDDFKANRDKVMSKKIVDITFRIINDQLRKASQAGKVDDAMKNADGIDQKVLAELKETYKITDEEFNKWWKDAESLRQDKKRRASMGTGTWIVKGGQNGGFDSGQGAGGNGRGPGGGSGGGGQGGSRNPLDEFRKKVPGGQVPIPGMGGQGQPQGQGQAQGQGQDPRKKLQTKDEWWSSQTASVREDFLEAYWASKSNLVQSTRKETERKCTLCNGAGSLKAQRFGQFVDVVCSRCHGSQIELEITYW